MARIVYSALIDNIKGSIGGTTFQKNKHGYTIKKKPNIVNPNTSSQSVRKGAFSKVVRAWRDLSSANRTYYANYASSFPQYSKNNPSSQLSGFEVFVKYNLLLQLCTSTIKETITQSIPATDTLSYIIENDSGDLDLDIDSLNDDEVWRILIFMSLPLHSSINFVGSRTRYIHSTTNVDNLLDITDEYSAVYGIIPSIGDLIALDVVLIGYDSPYCLSRATEILTVAAP